MSLEHVKCPDCGGKAIFVTRAGTHVCDCGWKNIETCAYPKCGNTTVYPSKLCYPHKEMAGFISWLYSDVLKGTIDNVKALKVLVKGK